MVGLTLWALPGYMSHNSHMSRLFIAAISCLLHPAIASCVNAALANAAHVPGVCCRMSRLLLLVFIVVARALRVARLGTALFLACRHLQLLFMLQFALLLLLLLLLCS